MNPVTNLDPNEIPEGFTATDPNSSSNDQKKAQQAQEEAQRQSILEQALTPEAAERLRRVKLVKPDRVASLERSIASMAMQRKLPGRITEGKLIEMLEGMVAKETQREPAAGKISIQRKKYAFDSDESDDDDEDLM